MNINPNFKIYWALGLLFTFVGSQVTWGQEDAVYRMRQGGGSARVNGKILDVTPYAISVRTDSGNKEIPASEITKIKIYDEPLEIGRARERIKSGRFADAISELDKISEEIKLPVLQQEVAYLRADATARIALTSGGFSAQDAGKLMLKFVNENKQSYHFYPATETLGKILLAIGKPDRARQEFQTLTQSRWPELVLKGLFYHGETLLAVGNHSAAKKEYEKLLAIEGNDELTLSYQQLAKCQIAKSTALAGDPETAIKAIQEIIKLQNPDDSRLFAYAYNALGTAELQANRLKEARTAFLHTDLLFASEPEPHAEALYQLSLIWPKLEKTDRASQARHKLKARYRNSYWASKLQ